MRARHFFGRQFEHSGREILSVNGAALFIQPCRQHGSSKPNVQHRSVWGLHDSLKNCGKYLFVSGKRVGIRFVRKTDTFVISICPQVKSFVVQHSCLLKF